MKVGPRGSVCSTAAPVDTPHELALAAAGYNPINLSPATPQFDLNTDSWAQLDREFLTNHMSRLYAGLTGPPGELKDELARLFPFPHVASFASGAWPNPIS